MQVSPEVDFINTSLCVSFSMGRARKDGRQSYRL